MCKIGRFFVLALLFASLGVLSEGICSAPDVSTRALDPNRPPRRFGVDSAQERRSDLQSPAIEKNLRSLNGNYFFKSTLLTYPFIAPYVNLTLEAAEATIHVDGAEQDIKAVGFSPSAKGQFRIWRLGVELGSDFSEIVGSDSYSALILGASFQYGFSTGVRFELVRTDFFALTPAFFYSWGKGASFSPIYAVDKLIDSAAKARGSQLLIKSTSRELRPTLLMAYVPDPVIGLDGEIGVGYSTLDFVDQVKKTFLRWGLGANLNYKRELGIPLGMTFAYRNDIPLNSSDKSTPLIAAGIYEMMRNNFNFGVEFSKLISNNPSLSAILNLTAYY